MIPVEEIQARLLQSKRENPKMKFRTEISSAAGYFFRIPDARLPSLDPGSYVVRFFVYDPDSDLPQDPEFETDFKIEKNEKKEKPEPVATPVQGTDRALEMMTTFFNAQLQAERSQSERLVSMLRENEDRLDRRLKSLLENIPMNGGPAPVSQGQSILEKIVPLIVHAMQQKQQPAEIEETTTTEEEIHDDENR